MRATTWIASTLLIVLLSAVTTQAQDGQSRIASRLKRVLHPSTSKTSAQAPTTQSGADPYGFAGILNGIRASAGLHPLTYDNSLSVWARRNNSAQCLQGVGHHINPNCSQNCAWNHTSATDVAQGWMQSPGHRRNMLSPSVTHFGIAYGPGPYWTLNTR